MLLDLLLPPTCSGCDESVGAPGQLCAACFSKLAFIAGPVCESCGVPLATSLAFGAPCYACVREPPPWSAARAALAYDEASRRMILALKHADRTEIAVTLALHMNRVGQGLLRRADLLVPVPLHRWRLLRRRYNQAALLAVAVGRRAGKPSLADALRRIRATPSLGQMSAPERAALMMGSIEVRRSRRAAVAGRRVVLIDDVLTSGATARACTRALLDAGALSVDVLVASRVADPRRDAPLPFSGDDLEDS